MEYEDPNPPSSLPPESTKNASFWIFWHERSAVQSVGVRAVDGNGVGGHYKRHNFFSSSILHLLFSPSQPFLKEGGLGSKQKIFSKTRFDRKYLGKHHGIGSFVNQNSIVMVNSN